MGSRLVATEEILDSLDGSAGQSPESAKRRSPRRTWRKHLKVVVTQPGGDQRKIDIVTRNLSRGGLSLLYKGFLHIGTRSELQLITAEGSWLEVQATVVRCRYVADGLHEVSLRFDEPLDDSQLVSRELSASILVVDDAEDALRLTTHFLSKAGADVVTANRGVRALKLIAEQDFDLVLLDVEMPGISGPIVAKTLRERGITVPIIAYTAIDEPTTRAECLAAGCSDVLTKPLSRADLIDVVARYLAVEEPIVSKYASNPEMAQFIHDLVAGFPARMQKMLQCLQLQNTEELTSLASQLKVAASDEGGCGLGELSAAADTLVRALTGTADWAAADEAVHSLCRLSHRVKETNE